MALNYLHRLLPGDRLVVTVPQGTPRLWPRQRRKHTILRVEKAILENKTFYDFSYSDPYNDTTTAFVRPVVKSINVCAVMANGQAIQTLRFSYMPTDFSKIVAVWRGRQRYDSPKDLPRSDITSTTNSTYVPITRQTGQTTA